MEAQALTTEKTVTNQMYMRVKNTMYFCTNETPCFVGDSSGHITHSACEYICPDVLNVNYWVDSRFIPL